MVNPLVPKPSSSGLLNPHGEYYSVKPRYIHGQSTKKNRLLFEDMYICLVVYLPL